MSKQIIRDQYGTEVGSVKGTPDFLDPDRKTIYDKWGNPVGETTTSFLDKEKTIIKNNQGDVVATAESAWLKNEKRVKNPQGITIGTVSTGSDGGTGGTILLFVLMGLGAIVWLSFSSALERIRGYYFNPADNMLEIIMVCIVPGVALIISFICCLKKVENIWNTWIGVLIQFAAVVLAFLGAAAVGGIITGIEGGSQWILAILEMIAAFVLFACYNLAPFCIIMLPCWLVFSIIWAIYFKVKKP